MAKKEDIYRKALLSLNIRYDQIKSNTDSIEIDYCKEYLRSAETFCATIRPWYWLIKREEYSEEDVISDEPSFNGAEYAYDPPKDMLYPYLVNGEYNHDIKTGVGGTIYINEPLETLEYISSEVEYDEFVGEKQTSKWKYPDVYANLIAIRLALEIAPFIAPDTAIEQRVANQFQLTLQTLNKLDLDGWRRRNPDPKEFVQ